VTREEELKVVFDSRYAEASLERADMQVTLTDEDQ